MTDQGRSNEELHQKVIDLRRRLELSETERKRVGDESEHILNHSPALLCVAGLDGHYKQVNPAFEKILGYSEEESLSKPFFAFIHPDDRQKAEACLEKLAAGEPVVNFEDRNICKDGTYRWLSWTVVPLPEKGVVYGIGQDITELKHAEEGLRKAQEELERRVDKRTAELLKANESLSGEMRERRRTEETLQESESRFRALVENTSDIIWELDENNILTYISPKIKDILGYETDEIIDKTPFDFMPPGEVERMEHAIRGIIESGQAFAELETTFLHQDGRQVVLESGGERIAGGDSEYRGFRGISRDVTERKRAEEALRQSEEQYHQIFESIADSLFVGDLEGRIVAANPAACEMHGYSQEEIIGLPVLELIHPDDHQRFDEFLKAVETGGTYRTESVEVRKDGSTFDVEIFGGPFVYRGRPHLLAIVRDITDRKKAEKELRQSEETARALINAPTESFVLLESDGTAVILNETAARRLGGSVQELVGKCVWDLMPPDVAQPRKARCDEVIRSGDAVCFEDLREGRVFQSCIYPLRNASGQVARLAIYSQDITDHKKADEAVLKEREHLKRSLEASDRERKLVAYDIHDGLAQHLTAAIMKFQSVAQLQSTHGEEASEIFNSGLGLLDHALAEARRLIGGVRPPILDEMGIVAAVEHLVASTTSNGGPEIAVNADVKFDRLEPALENTLFRIIQESLTNACMHSDSDKVRLTLTESSKHLQVEIQDWGIGFDVESIEEGNFGLEGIRERSRLLGGNAVIDSEPGKGTRVAVKLPLPEEV